VLQAADAAAGSQQYPAAALYVVATPIGNLADITLRAVHVLARVDRIACEDTRHTALLLRHLGLHRPLLALHAHNEAQASAAVCEALGRGERVAVVSDAGTPAVSDPGAVLVAAVRAAGHRVVPLPGPSSALAALCAAGDIRGDGFRVRGFLPARGAARDAALRAALDDAGTQVLFEAPHRILALARELQAAAGPAHAQRPVTVARELTKQFESIETVPLQALLGWLQADAQRQRGEFVLVLHAAPGAGEGGSDGGLPLETRRLLQVLLEELPLKQAVGLAARASGLPRNALYAAALTLRPGGAADGEPPQDPPGS
jgi:16S rRNA (cytidine1402-2'-O)-methyltransferase